jgi:hypothetical protein
MRGYYARKIPVLRDVVRQYFSPPEIAIIGSVHRENVGDMALSESVASILEERGARTGMQLLGDGRLGLSRWPLGEGKAMVAGGALGREKRIRPLVDRFREQPGQVALIGMSFWSLDELSQDSLDFLRRVGYISCRNRRDVEELKNEGISDAKFAYDSAFSFPLRETEAQPKRLGMNVVSRHMVREGREYIPSEDRPNFGPNYIRAMRRVAQSHLDRGWRVVHIPFTKEDELYAEVVFDGVDVEEKRYDYNVERVYEGVSRCARFVGTRYHAHVFSLLAQVPFLSFSYATKCTLLKEDLSMPETAQATREEVVSDSEEVAERFLTQDGFTLDDRSLQEIRSGVRANIKNAYDAISSS